MEVPEQQQAPTPPNVQVGPQQKSLLSHQVQARGPLATAIPRAAIAGVAWMAVHKERTLPALPTRCGDSAQGGPDTPRAAKTSRSGDLEVRSRTRSIAMRSGTTTMYPPLLPEPLDGPDMACTGSPMVTGIPCLELEVVLA